MKWMVDSPQTGDILRVRKNNVFHYGICVAKDRAVEFGAAEEVKNAPHEAVKVRECPITDFTSEASFCVGRAEKEEHAFSPYTVAARERTMIGEGNYDFVRNNCEHFVYECVVGRHVAPESEKFEALFSALPKAWVCVSPYPFSFDGKNESIFPTARRREIEQSRSARVREQKYYVWKLLEKALADGFGMKIKNADLRRDEAGKWKSDKVFVSLSHTAGVCAVAVSNVPVGIDIEAFASPRFNARLAAHILTENEKKRYATLGEDEKSLFCACAWTGKESTFKREDKTVFVPSETDGFDRTVFGRVRTDGGESVLAFSCEKKVKICFRALGGAQLDKIEF